MVADDWWLVLVAKCTLYERECISVATDVKYALYGDICTALTNVTIAGTGAVAAAADDDDGGFGNGLYLSSPWGLLMSRVMKSKERKQLQTCRDHKALQVCIFKIYCFQTTMKGN
ncbi:hypothetical protein DOY81_013171 [Sarcophaga bullata]|nr:hypothetical protein DOY81_013171 [Sarcophaga bullata]